MLTKKKVFAVLAISILIINLTACTQPLNSEPKTRKQDQTEQFSEPPSESSDENVLITKENNIFDSHKNLWDKVFNSISNSEKESAVAKDKSYDQFLRVQINNMKKIFSEDELKTLYEDIEKISEIEKKLKDIDKRNK